MLIVFLVLCIATIIVKSIITSDWKTFIVIAIIAVVVILNEILDKCKKKTDEIWRQNLIKFVSVLIYLAAIACGYFAFDLF